MNGRAFTRNPRMRGKHYHHQTVIGGLGLLAMIRQSITVVTRVDGLAYDHHQHAQRNGNEIFLPVGNCTAGTKKASMS